jgi:hypothetical protein
LEQTSSETTAGYKAELISGDSLIDLTGGFGIDDYYFSKKVNHVVHCEINDTLSEIVKHNCKQLNIQNIECIAGDSTDILKKQNQKFDWIYIDPSRRNEAKGKVFLLKDCLPNVPELLDFYFEYSSNIMIKTAPILDISAGISELKNIMEIHIVAVENEVKELLWIIQRNYRETIKIIACNFTRKNRELFSFPYTENEMTANYAFPEKYLYEPNAAIMKSGGFNEVALQFNVSKLHPHSHLYTSENQIDFPGRTFEIINQIDYSKADMKENLSCQKANITTRNFPETVETLRKKWKIKEGGDLYCFFTTDKNNRKIVLLCKKIVNP